MAPAIKLYEAFVPGVPRPHQRPGRAGRAWVQRHDRPHDLNWRTAVRATWLTQVGALAWPWPVRLTLIFFGGQGDLDNKVKAVLDALGARGWQDGLAPVYLDDGQVVALVAEQYPASVAESGCQIRAEWLPPRKKHSHSWRAAPS